MNASTKWQQLWVLAELPSERPNHKLTLMWFYPTYADADADDDADEDDDDNDKVWNDGQRLLARKTWNKMRNTGWCSASPAPLSSLRSLFVIIRFAWLWHFSDYPNRRHCRQGVWCVCACMCVCLYGFRRGLFGSSDRTAVITTFLFMFCNCVPWVLSVFDSYDEEKCGCHTYVHRHTCIHTFMQFSHSRTLFLSLSRCVWMMH